MGKRKKSKQRVDTSAKGALTSSPFAGLADLRADLPAGDVEQTPPPSPETPRRAVVRFQRKGRGGKEVTLVEKLELTEDQRDAWLKELRRGLGCGGALEGEVLVLQGDQRERLPAMLRQRGVGKISVS